MLSTPKVEDVLKNCCVFDVDDFHNLKFKSRRIGSFCSFQLPNFRSRRTESFSSSQIDKEIEGQIGRQIDA